MEKVKKVLFVPAKGVKVRDPKTMRLVPEEGAMVERNAYYVRRVKDGDGEFKKVNPVASEKGRKKSKSKPETDMPLLQSETEAKN